MSAAARALPVLLLLATAGEASAHTVFGFAGFPGGLLHPVAVPSHLMALVALGLLLGGQGWGVSALAAYIVAVLAGLGAIALAYVPAYAELVLLALAAVTGLLVALARPMPWTIGILLAAATGLALALDSPPEGISLADANLALLGTALSAMISLAILVWLVRHLRRDWQRIGARIVGSWIAASAILVLALRLSA